MWPRCSICTVSQPRPPIRLLLVSRWPEGTGVTPSLLYIHAWHLNHCCVTLLTVCVVRVPPASCLTPLRGFTHYVFVCLLVVLLLSIASALLLLGVVWCFGVYAGIGSFFFLCRLANMCDTTSAACVQRRMPLVLVCNDDYICCICWLGFAGCLSFSRWLPSTPAVRCSTAQPLPEVLAGQRASYSNRRRIGAVILSHRYIFVQQRMWSLALCRML